MLIVGEFGVVKVLSETKWEYGEPIIRRSQVRVLVGPLSRVGFFVTEQCP